MGKKLIAVWRFRGVEVRKNQSRGSVFAVLRYEKTNRGAVFLRY
jgi:hypothetical protein